MKVKSLSRVRLLATAQTAAYQLRRPWDFPGRSTGVGCHCHIMQNARLDEAQAGVKIAGKNINNLGYADDTTLMAENE